MEKDQWSQLAETSILVPKKPTIETMDFNLLSELNVFHFVVDEGSETRILIKYEGDQYYPDIADIINISGEWSDDYGSLPNKGQIQLSSRIWESECLIEVYHDSWQFLQATTQIEIETRVPKYTDILLLTLTGPTEDLVHVVAFWKTALNHQWLNCHGRKLVYQVIDENKVYLIFLPAPNHSATPARMLRDLLQIPLTRVAIQSFSEFTNRRARCIVKLKLDHRNIRGYAFQSNQHVAQLYLILQHTWSLTFFGESPAIVFRGRRVGDVVNFGTLAEWRRIGAKQQHKQAVQCIQHLQLCYWKRVALSIRLPNPHLI